MCAITHLIKHTQTLKSSLCVVQRLFANVIKVLCKITKPVHFFFVYAAPEMLKGDVVGPPADIWNVGVLTFIM